MTGLIYTHSVVIIYIWMVVCAFLFLVTCVLWTFVFPYWLCKMRREPFIPFLKRVYYSDLKELKQCKPQLVDLFRSVWIVLLLLLLGLIPFGIFFGSHQHP